MKQKIILGLLICFSTNLFSQSLSINTTGAAGDGSAMLDVSSTTKGLLIPRMSRTERNAIASPATGLLIFQNGPDSIGLHYYDGTKWTWMFSNSNSDSLAWRTKGNTGTTDPNNFIGTVDNVSLNFKVNNQKSGRIATSGETFFGYFAGSANSSNYATGVGFLALANNTTGNDNTAIGREALRFNTTGAANTASGKDALLSNTTGNSNVAMGYQALVDNGTGSNNTGIGNNAIRNNTTASNNTALGYNAMRNNTTGSDNVAIGTNALFTNTTGIKNVALGGEVLTFNTGNQNIGIGYYTLHFNTTGSQNVSVGEGSAITNSTGGHNTTIGFQPLFVNSTGNENVALGYQAGYNVTGSGNVMLGNLAGSTETGSNKLYIANNAVNPPIIYGDFSNKTLGFGTITPNSTYGYAKVEIASEGYLAPTDLLIRNAVSHAGYAPGLTLQHARGTLATPLTVVNGDYLAAVTSMNYDGTTHILSGGMDMYADAAVSTGIVPTRMHFYTMNSLGSYAARLTIKNDGKVGIGTTIPLARTHVSGGNFLVTGAFGTDSTLAFSGGGTRMFFYPRKAAFRAGFVNGTQWDDANIGNYSIGLGADAQAKTAYSVSIGEGNIAETGSFAVAIGRQNHSTGFASLAMGHFSEATGDYSVSIGLRDTVASFGGSSLGGYNKVLAGAFYSLAAGESNTVSGGDAFGMGFQNTVSAFGSAAIGMQNNATGYVTFVAGRANYTTGNHSTAFGFTDSSGADQAFTAGMFNTVKGNNSAAFGSFNYAPSYGEVTIGNYATQYAALNSTGLNTADRVFTIGNGTGAGSRSNAMVVLKNGNVGIGNSTPVSTLTVNGSVAGAIITTAASLSLDATHYCVVYTGPGGNVFTLPAAGTCTGRIYIITNHGTGVLNTSSYRIGNAATTATVNPGNAAQLMSDGIEWRRIN